MDVVGAARKALRFPVMDGKFMQLRQTLADGTEQFRDRMPPYHAYECAEIALPSDIVKSAIENLISASKHGLGLSPLEQLGHYLLLLKAEAEYVPPPPVVRPPVKSESDRQK